MDPQPVPTVTAVRLGRGYGLQGAAGARLRGRRLMLAQAAWVTMALLTAGLFIAALPAQFAQLQGVCSVAPCARDQLTPDAVRALQDLGLSVGFYATYSVWLDVALVLAYGGVAAVIFWRKSDDRVALFASLALLTFGAATFTSTTHALAEAHPEWWLPVTVLDILGAAAFGLFLYLFPDGRFVPHWARWVALIWTAWQLLRYGFPNWDADLGTWPAWVDIGVWVAALGTIIYSQIYRYRHVSSSVQRQQTKWVVLGISGALVGYLGATFALAAALAALGPAPASSSALVVLLVGDALQYFAMFLIPVSIGIAVLRYRLWDIDLIINRTLVYVPLTALVAGVVAASSTLSQKLVFTGEQSVAASVFTTLFLVTAFTPVRSQLQSVVDKYFKEVPDPRKKLQAFSVQVQSRLSAVGAQHVTRRLLEEAVRAFEAKGGAVSWVSNGDVSPIHTTGEWDGAAHLSVPLRSAEDSAQLGVLALGARRNGAEYTSQDRAMLQEAAQVVALAIEQDGRTTWQ